MQWLETAPEGVRLHVTTPLEEVEAVAAVGAETIVLEFSAFRDGRGFSIASVLRERGYVGRLIADGALLPDQARHLRRSGFDAVVLGPDADVAAWERMDTAFSAVYQPAAADPTVPAWRRRGGAPAPARSQEVLVERLNREAAGLDAGDIVQLALSPRAGLSPVVLSSFGADSAVLLALVARVEPATPVVFLDTGMHFFQTLAYRKSLSERLGLTDVRLVGPDPEDKARRDPKDDLWRSDLDACCDLRKVRPLQRALGDADAQITGRTRHETAARSDLKPFELFDGRVRVNPLHDWTPEQMQAWLQAEDLPRHPLVDQGYPSIGCWPCTRAVEAGEDARSGRWAGAEKTECGIHLGGRVAAAE